MTLRLPRPRGLRAQLLLLVLGALIAAQIVSLGMFLDERGRAVIFATAEEAAGRTLTLADVLDDAPRKAREAVLLSTRARDVRFALAAAPLAEAEGWEPLPRIARRIGWVLAARGRDLRIAQTAEDAAREEGWRSDHGDGRRDGGDRQDRGENDGDGRDRIAPRDSDVNAREAVAISVRLADGSWLNARVRLRRPPLQWAWPAFVSLGLSAVALTVAIWLAVGRIVRPMAALATAADRLGRGDRPDPLPLRGPEEARRLTGAFNAMAARLTRLLDERARTLGAIGHDLRSPITAMRIRIEMVDDDETRDRLTASVDEMQTLVEGALALSRGGGAEEPMEDVAVGALLAGLVEEMTEAGAAAELEIASEVSVPARPMALKRALRNLAENAVRYGGVARIALTRRAGGARIEIDDDGPGVAPEDRARVFEPFVRLEASRSRETGGAGLGLAIARAAIEGMGGKVWLEEAPGDGTRAVAILPEGG